MHKGKSYQVVVGREMCRRGGEEEWEEVED